jgi:hypothetical protein
MDPNVSQLNRTKTNQNLESFGAAHVATEQWGIGGVVGSRGAAWDDLVDLHGGDVKAAARAVDSKYPEMAANQKYLRDNPDRPRHPQNDPRIPDRYSPQR